MAAEYADDDDEKTVILDLRKATLEELKLHDSVMKEWGVDPNKEIAPNPATLKYTEFVLATAKGKVDGGKGPGQIATPFEKTKIAAYAISAMTPCMRLYAHLGKELQMFLPHDGGDHPYKKWIDYYSSKSFEAETVQIEELLDKLSVPLTGEELDLIEKLYHQAMKLETEFFSAQPITQQSVVPLTKLNDPIERLYIFSGFDLTCTIVDSSAILAEIAILTASKIDQGIAEAKKISSDMRSSWDALSSKYTEEYEACIEGLLPKEEVKEFDYEHLHKSLEQLANFEKRTNSRVVESGMLRGVNLHDIKRAGEHLKLHDGCKDFFQKIVKKKETLTVDLHILSYCWCADLIRSAFSSVGCLNELSIHSNEFNFEGSISTGEIDIKMQSPVDKVEAVNNVLNQNSSNKYLSVYIGGSVGDLLCLLKADVGIVVGSSGSLRRVGKQFGVSFVPLFPGVVAKQREGSAWRGLSGTLYTASNWSEIQAFVLGT
ncbi:uncharacterized protein A4U43_C04F33970 [Asparagus officinalis]|uniref:Thiaminase-2/PQQC domain-containing protein n=2 Tax=Asparagus officinalis TaxID=4686 RepID=A0A5P1F7F7_ASPOF|nr:uncharacterized protein A4U43_C04F33970 [Asparagus officinalis]